MLKHIPFGNCGFFINIFFILGWWHVFFYIPKKQWGYSNGPKGFYFEAFE